MTHQYKIDFLQAWATKNSVELELTGECGFGRECVGIITDGHYIDYHWYDDEYNQVDSNGDVWTPPNAYHKHECLAVLGRGEEAESQLYEWIKWFDDNGFQLQVTINPIPMPFEFFASIMYRGTIARMVKV